MSDTRFVIQREFKRSTFTEQAGTTRMVLHAEPFGASDMELRFFAELIASSSLEQGYGRTFDQLAAHLLKA